MVKAYREKVIDNLYPEKCYQMKAIQEQFAKRSLLKKKKVMRQGRRDGPASVECARLC